VTAKGAEKVVVRKAATRNRTGDVIPGAVVGTLDRCIVWPRSSTETADRGIVGIDGFHVWAPAPNAVTPSGSDSVEIRGGIYEIEGQPGDWRSRRGRKKGLLFEVTKYG
jgi:hypothetical protein